MDALLRRTRSDSSSGYTGVKRNGGRWLAQIRKSGGQELWRATFDTPEEAHEARTAALGRLCPETRVVGKPEPPAVRSARWIRLNHGKFALVDAVDFDRVVAAGNWRFSNGYAKLGVGRGTISLQAFILQPLAGLEVDHIDQATLLDCRRSNIRIATRAENIRHRRKNRNNTSGYIGVTWHKGAQKWMAQASVKRRHVHLGLFGTAEEAARARDALIRELHGEFASLNFP